jgi:hypothetical protein
LRYWWEMQVDLSNRRSILTRPSTAFGCHSTYYKFQLYLLTHYTTPSINSKLHKVPTKSSVFTNVYS